MTTFFTVIKERFKKNLSKIVYECLKKNIITQ